MLLLRQSLALQDPKERKDPKEHKDSKDSKEHKEQRESEEEQVLKVPVVDLQDPKVLKVLLGQRERWVLKVQRDQLVLWGHKEYRGHKGS